MKDKIIKIIKDNWQMFMYLVFGGLTTLVDIVSYFLLTRFFGANQVTATILAWFLAVLFAFITNRKYVFKSESDKKNIFYECVSFYLSRALTGGLNLVLMVVFVDHLGFNDLFVKIIANIIVIILNYILSKFIIFKRPQ